MDRFVRTLIITDMQNDFMPGGALGIPQADRLIPLINHLMPHFDHVIATLDWHPPHHVSFASTHHKKPGDVIQAGSVQQILWPDHCVQNTHGSAIAPELNQKPIEKFFHKGTDPEVDSYSIFFDALHRPSTGLHSYLQSKKYQDLYFVGVALDYCIYHSVLDALDLHYHATVIQDACQAIHLHSGDDHKAILKMKQKGAKIALSSEL